MTAPVQGLADVQSRIAQVEARIASLSGRPPVTRTAAAPAAGTSALGGPASFDSLLARATGAASGGPTGADVVEEAKKHLGVPYVWGGTDPRTGLDCSGLVQTVMGDLGIDVPRTAAQQATVGTEVPSLDQAQPGDLVVLKGGAHIGIYVGDGKMLHAPKSGDVVKIADVYETPMTIRRLVPDASSAPAATGLDAAAYTRPAALRGASSAAPAAYDALFAAATAKHDLPAGLLAAVAQTESGFRADAVSPAGARGLMQIMPGTAKELGVDPMVPAQAVDGAARLLSQHLESFGSLDLALAAYNAGPGAVRRHDGVPPFPETQNYVRKVTDLMSRSAA